jgi:MFS family permease
LLTKCGRCTGIIPLSNCQVIIYQKIGASPVLSLLLTGVWGTVSCFSVLTLGFWVDKIGRRNALSLGYSIMIPAGCIIVGCWAGFESSGNLNLAKVVNFGIFLTDLGFSGIMNTFGPAYGAEIMPTNIGSAGVAIGYFVFNVLIILHVQTATLAIAALAWRYFLIFLCLDCVFVVIVYFLYPETKGKTLEEIEGIFGDKLAETWDQTGKEYRIEHDLSPCRPRRR